MTRILLAASLLAAAAMPAPVRADTSATCTGMITALPVVIATRGTWCMDKDLATNIASGNAITLHTNQITLDCNGYRISGLAAGLSTDATGIYAGNRTLLTVRNCGVRGFARGIQLVASASLVENNHLDQNRIEGINVGGDGNLVRGNRVVDTGASTQAIGSVYGILASNNTDVRDNFVEGVHASAHADSYAYGIRLIGGLGVQVSGNHVRGLFPSGTGYANGIYTSNGQRIFIDGNRVALLPTVANSMGYRCNGIQGSLRNSSEWGFTTSVSGCQDGGGNVDR